MTATCAGARSWRVLDAVGRSRGSEASWPAGRRGFERGSRNCRAVRLLGASTRSSARRSRRTMERANPPTLYCSSPPRRGSGASCALGCTDERGKLLRWSLDSSGGHHRPARTAWPLVRRALRTRHVCYAIATLPCAVPRAIVVTFAMGLSSRSHPLAGTTRCVPRAARIVARTLLRPPRELIGRRRLVRWRTIRRASGRHPRRCGPTLAHPGRDARCAAARRHDFAHRDMHARAHSLHSCALATCIGGARAHLSGHRARVASPFSRRTARCRGSG